MTVEFRGSWGKNVSPVEGDAISAASKDRADLLHRRTASCFTVE